jgi:hypothetical protein
VFECGISGVRKKKKNERKVSGKKSKCFAVLIFKIKDLKRNKVQIAGRNKNDCGCRART